MISTKDKIKAAQSAVGSFPDGKPGDSTWDAFYRFLDAEGYLQIHFPYEVSQWKCKVVWGNPDDLTPISLADSYSCVRNWDYSMSGSFTVLEATGRLEPVSILVSDGKVIRGHSCHSADKDGSKPETVLYQLDNGVQGITLAKYPHDLPEGLKWAIGGLRIVENGNPTPRSFNENIEGFTERYSDVFRTTAHCAIGFDQYGNVGGVYHPRCSLANFQQRLIKIGLVDAISIDGGHISAFNCGSLIANPNTRQGYLIQF